MRMVVVPCGFPKKRIGERIGLPLHPRGGRTESKGLAVAMGHGKSRDGKGDLERPSEIIIVIIKTLKERGITIIGRLYCVEKGDRRCLVITTPFRCKPSLDR